MSRVGCRREFRVLRGSIPFPMMRYCTSYDMKRPLHCLFASIYLLICAATLTAGKPKPIFNGRTLARYAVTEYFRRRDIPLWPNNGGDVA